ncbi:unannotated protein [freshwater metagenome]|uniref:Unannotated protein n=1 Tax=freshwater metagenome TaxID=449393 RepID=A0A6J6DU61_9ZZZZ
MRDQVGISTIAPKVSSKLAVAALLTSGGNSDVTGSDQYPR